MTHTQSLGLGLCALVGTLFAQDLSWQQTGPIKVYEWTQNASEPAFGGKFTSTEIKSIQNLQALRIAGGAPVPLQILQGFSAQAQKWSAQNATIWTLNSQGKWKDSTQSIWTWYSPNPKIVLPDGNALTADPSKFKNTLRILTQAADTAQGGLLKMPMTEQYVIKGILSGASVPDSNTTHIWYASAVIYQGDTVKYLAQINNGDSVKVRNTIANSLSNFTYDSLKIQLCDLSYQWNSPSLARPLDPSPSAPKTAKIIRGPFEMDGRTIRISQQSDTKQLLNVFNAAGEVLQFWKFINLNGFKEVQLDQAHFPAGVYFLKLYNSSGSYQTQAILKD